jgi:fatty-acid desaturase
VYEGVYACMDGCMRVCMFTVMRVSTVDAYRFLCVKVYMRICVNAYMRVCGVCVYVKEAWSHVLYAAHAAYDAFLCMYGCVYSCTRACMEACTRACVSGHMHVGLVVASHVCARMRLARVCVLCAALR